MNGRVFAILGITLSAACVAVTGSLVLDASPLKGGASAATAPSESGVGLHLLIERLQAPAGPDEQEPHWAPVTGELPVTPGSVLRYTVRAENRGARPVAGLVVTQPIPPGTTYLPGQTDAEGVATTYSIDRGQSFASEPMVAVTLPDGTVESRPAPAEAFTHVRWTLVQPLPGRAATRLGFQAVVR